VEESTRDLKTDGYCRMSNLHFKRKGFKTCVTLALALIIADECHVGVQIEGCISISLSIDEKNHTFPPGDTPTYEHCISCKLGI